MKIPNRFYKSKDVIAIGYYAIYTKNLISASKVAEILLERDLRRGIPCMGKMKLNGVDYYWCRYGFLNDPDIYAKKLNKR